MKKIPRYKPIKLKMIYIIVGLKRINSNVIKIVLSD